MERLRSKEGFICDMDGVIYHGNRLLPGVKEFVNWLVDNKKNFLFLTNSSQYTPRELQNKLARMGLDVDETHFYTSALATACFLDTQSPGCSAYVIGEHGILNALYDKGIMYNDVDPDYVVVAIDASVGSPDHVGFATLGRGALQPGLGVSKDLEAVGDISITGIVGGGGSPDPVMLQSVRLSMVMKMADCICESITLVERFWENAARI